jgi:hypothetical protein
VSDQSAIDTELVCPRCGGDMELVECEQCGGAGETEPGELYEIDPLWYDPDDTEPCAQCAGTRLFVCVNSEEWCSAHPLPGHESHNRSIVIDRGGNIRR